MTLNGSQLKVLFISRLFFKIHAFCLLKAAFQVKPLLSVTRYCERSNLLMVSVTQ